MSSCFNLLRILKPFLIFLTYSAPCRSAASSANRHASDRDRYALWPAFPRWHGSCRTIFSGTSIAPSFAAPSGGNRRHCLSRCNPAIKIVLGFRATTLISIQACSVAAKFTAGAREKPRWCPIQSRHNSPSRNSIGFPPQSRNPPAVNHIGRFNTHPHLFTGRDVKFIGRNHTLLPDTGYPTTTGGQ